MWIVFASAVTSEVNEAPRTNLRSLREAPKQCMPPMSYCFEMPTAWRLFVAHVSNAVTTYYYRGFLTYALLLGLQCALDITICMRWQR